MGRKKSGSVSANWDRDLTNVFCDVALREIELGNRPSTYFNKVDWTNFETRFKELTGRAYKWDQLKKDWKIWKDLRTGSTGLGWDTSRRTIDAPEEWWDERLKVNPQARKFRYNGIDPSLEDKLDRMFGGIVATGHRAWAPSMTSQPDQMDEETEVNMATDTFPEFDDLGNFSQPRETSAGPSKRRRSGKNVSYDEKLERIASACETIVTQSVKSVSSPSSMAKATLAVEQMADVRADMDLYLFSLRFLKDKDNRTTFLNMDPLRRETFLRHCHGHGYFWFPFRTSTPYYKLI